MVLAFLHHSSLLIPRDTSWEGLGEWIVHGEMWDGELIRIQFKISADKYKQWLKGKLKSCNKETCKKNVKKRANEWGRKEIYSKI